MTRTLPVTLTLLLACVGVFLYQMSLSGDDYLRFLVRYALIPRLLLGDPIDTAGYSLLPAPLTLVTSMFVHSDTAHLVVNMIVLISFGAIVERALGAWRLAAIYAVAGVAGEADDDIGDGCFRGSTGGRLPCDREGHVRLLRCGRALLNADRNRRHALRAVRSPSAGW